MPGIWTTRATTPTDGGSETTPDHTSYVATVGDGSDTEFTVTHGLNVGAVFVQCWLSGDLVLADVTVVDANTITVSTAPTVVTADALTVAIHGAGDPEELGTVEFVMVGAVS